MAERVDAATLDGLSKKELVVLVQSVAPLDLLQANALSGKPENVAKKANKDKIIEVYNKVFEDGLITSEADREAARLAKDLEIKAKLEEEAKAKAEAAAADNKSARLPIEEEAGVFVDPTIKMYALNLTKKNKLGIKAQKGDVVRLHYTGRLEDGTIFDSTVDPEFVRNKNLKEGKTFGAKGQVSQRGSALEFKVGSNQVIRGWDECVREMAEGECAAVTVQPEWAYGTKGSLHTKQAGKLIPAWPYLHHSVGVPPNAVLSFELEVVSIK